MSNRLAALAGVALAALAAAPAHANLAVNLVAHFRFNAAPNTIGFPTGDSQMIVVNVTPNPATGDATTRITAAQGDVTVDVPYFGPPTNRNDYRVIVPFSSATAGAWALTITNDTASNSPLSRLTPALIRPDGSIAPVAPFPTNLALDLSADRPVFTFDAPEDAVFDLVGIRILDLSRERLQIHRVNGLPGGTRSYTIPPVLNPEGDTLRPGGHYAIGAIFDVLRRTAEGAPAGVISRSISFLEFRMPGGEEPPAVAIPEPAAFALFGFALAGLAAARRRID